MYSDLSVARSLGTDTSRVVALVGSPNSGKTTLFNWLTGSRFKTVNYPGATVDYSVGKTHERYGAQIQVMDTPGTYSLDPKSPDEQVTHDAIFNHREFGRAGLVVSIADATHLSRHLFLTKQIKAAGFHVILAVTMADLLTERGETLDTSKLSEKLGLPVVLIDGRLGGGVIELVEAIRFALSGIDVKTPAPRILNDEAVWSHEKVEAALRETDELSRAVIQKKASSLESRGAHERLTSAERSRRIDRVALHPVWGLISFITIMAGFFSAIFWLAKPVMELVDKSFSFMGEQVLNLNPESLVLQFMSQGVIASLAAVLVFVPQIFILFLGITLLEDSGYLARSATLIDRPLSMLGMGGRSFVPLLSGYACAVPAMLASRTINSRRERWLTLFIIPLMSCSARLPVYALLLSFLFYEQSAWKPGLALAGLYLGSLLLGAVVAVIAGRFLKVSDQSFFMMELPIYRRPHPKHVLHQAVTRTKSYVMRAGPAIFAFALIIWVATTFPRADLKDPSERLEGSYAARVGQLIEPVFEPMGGDWRTGVGLISAFAAREVFVSSLAIVFHVAGDDSDDSAQASMQQTLISSMKAAKTKDGYPLFTVSSVLGLIVFFMVALQCLSTVMVAVRESGGWKFALVQLVVFNAVGYALSVLIVQGLRSIGIA
jgi:ferrous iron transport protein B